MTANEPIRLELSLPKARLSPDEDVATVGENVKVDERELEVSMVALVCSTSQMASSAAVVRVVQTLLAVTLPTTFMALARELLVTCRSVVGSRLASSSEGKEVVKGSARTTV